MHRSSRLLAAVAAVAVAGVAAVAISVAPVPAPPPPSSPYASDRASDAPNLTRLRGALVNDEPITVYALGSSVGVGASLPHPATQSPSAYLAAGLTNLGASDVKLLNLSVNGSVALEGVSIWEDQIRPEQPTVLLLTYGMNDGATSAYNSGQTLPGGIDAVGRIVAEAISDGVTVLVATTPSPHTGRMDFALPSDSVLIYPEYGADLTTATNVITVNGSAFSARHANINGQYRALTTRAGATLIDVVPSWTSVARELGEDALFDVAETVHPNLLGHQSSYWAAIDEFVDTRLYLGPRR